MTDVWRRPNDLDAIERHVAASNHIGLVEARVFRNLIAELRARRQGLAICDACGEVIRPGQGMAGGGGGGVAFTRHAACPPRVVADATADSPTPPPPLDLDALERLRAAATVTSEQLAAGADYYRDEYMMIWADGRAASDYLRQAAVALPHLLRLARAAQRLLDLDDFRRRVPYHDPGCDPDSEDAILAEIRAALEGRAP